MCANITHSDSLGDGSYSVDEGQEVPSLLNTQTSSPVIPDGWMRLAPGSSVKVDEDQFWSGSSWQTVYSSYKVVLPEHIVITPLVDIQPLPEGCPPLRAGYRLMEKGETLTGDDLRSVKDGGWVAERHLGQLPTVGCGTWEMGEWFWSTNRPKG